MSCLKKIDYNRFSFARLLLNFLNVAKWPGRAKEEASYLPKSHSLTSGMENFADIINGRLWPGRADDDARLLAKKRSFADVSDEKLRGHRQRPVMAGSSQRGRKVACRKAAIR